MASGEELARLRELERQSYEYGLPEQEDMSIFGKAVDLFTPFRRPIYREREETFTDPYFDERGELVVDRSVEPGLYGEPEFGLGYMPVVQGAMTAGESLAGLVTDPEARSRALEMAQAAPGAINRQMETSFQAAMRGEPELFDPEMGQAVSATDAILLNPMLLAPGTAAATAGVAGPLLGIMGGKSAATGPQRMDRFLETERRFVNNPERLSEVPIDVGYRGPDKNFRFLIDPSDAKVNTDMLGVLEEGRTLRLPNLLKFDEFFEEYPTARNIEVRMDFLPGETARKGVTIEGEAIVLQPSFFKLYPDDPREAVEDLNLAKLLPVVQEWVNEQENFPQPETRDDFDLDKLSSEMYDLSGSLRQSIAGSGLPEATGVSSNEILRFLVRKQRYLPFAKEEQEKLKEQITNASMPVINTENDSLTQFIEGDRFFSGLNRIRFNLPIDSPDQEFRQYLRDLKSAAARSGSPSASEIIPLADAYERSVLDAISRVSPLLDPDQNPVFARGLERAVQSEAAYDTAKAEYDVGLGRSIDRGYSELVRGLEDPTLRDPFGAFNPDLLERPNPLMLFNTREGRATDAPDYAVTEANLSRLGAVPDIPKTPPRIEGSLVERITDAEGPKKLEDWKKFLDPGRGSGVNKKEIQRSGIFQFLDSDEANRMLSNNDGVLDAADLLMYMERPGVEKTIEKTVVPATQYTGPSFAVPSLNSRNHKLEFLSVSDRPLPKLQVREDSEYGGTRIVFPNGVTTPLMDRETAFAYAQTINKRIAYDYPHFGNQAPPNTIVHVRSQDMDVPGVGYVKFVDEIQSDYHQRNQTEIRRRIKDLELEAKRQGKEFDPSDKNLRAAVEQEILTSPEGQARINQLINDYEGGPIEGLLRQIQQVPGIHPNLPYENRNWAALAIRSQFAEAARGGYDGVVFNTSKQAQEHGTASDKAALAYDNQNLDAAKKFAKKHGIEMQEINIPLFKPEEEDQWEAIGPIERQEKLSPFQGRGYFFRIPEDKREELSVATAYRKGGEVKKMDSKRPGIGQLVYDRYINPVQGFKRGGGAMGGRNFGVEREPLNPYAAMIAARDAKGAATPARGSTPGAIKKGPQPIIGPATARMPPEQEAAMRAATGNYAVGDRLRAEGYLPTRGPEVVLPAQTTVSTPLASELMMEPAAVPEDIVSRGTVGPVAPLPEPEPTMGPISPRPPAPQRDDEPVMPPQPVGPITAAPANIAEAGPSGGGAPAMDLYVQPDGSVMPGAAQQMVQPMTDGEGVPVDLGERIMAGEFREPVQELVDQGVIGSPQTAGEQLAQTGTGGDFGLEPIASGQNLQDFSYDNFDPNEVSYVRALFTQMGLDPDQNEIALQETLQNQFGTGAQVSGETLQLTFGNSDNSLLDAIGAVGTYGQFLDSQAQTAPGSGTGTTGDPVVGGTDLNVQPGGEILPGADDQGPLEPVGTGQTAGEQLAEETGGDFGLDEVKPGQNLQDFSYDNFDPNEVGYIRSLLNQMGIDPDQNEIVLQELLQNQFGTGAQVSGETLQLTFGNSDNSILDAMGVVGTYSDYLNSMNQPPPAGPAPADPGTGTGTGDQLPGEDLAGQDPAPADPYPGLITEGIVDGQFGYYRYDPDTMTDSSQAEFVPLSFEEYMGIFAPGQENFGKLRGPDGYEQLPMEFYQSEQFSNFLRQHAEEELRRQTDPNYVPPMSTMEYNMTSDGKYGFSGNDPLGGAYEAWLATQVGETTPVDPAPVDPAPVDPIYVPPEQGEEPPISQDPIFEVGPDPMPEAPEPTPVEYLSGVTPGFDVQTYIDQATAPIDRSAYTQGIEYGRNLMPGDPDEAGGYRIPVYTPTPRATYPGLTFRRQANRATTASQNIQAAQMAGAAIGGGGNYGGIPLNFDPNNWQGTSASLPPGVGGAEADQQITCPDGYVLSMENGNYYCKNVQQTGGGMSQAMRGPDRVDPIYVSVATAMNKGGEVMPAGIGSFFPEELVEQMGPGLVSSRERTYTYPSGVTVEETQSTGRFMFGDR